jgi:hypothetical protein
MVIKRAIKKIRFLCFCVVGITLIFSVMPTPCPAVSDLGIVVERMESKEGSIVDACKYCGKYVKVGHIHSDAEKIIKVKLQQALSEQGFGYKDGKEQQPYISVVIFRFQERKGGNFAVDKPAGVGLHMHLIEGSVVGRTFVFDEDQQALSENILGIGKFFRRGAKWITVEKLAEEGINKGTEYLLEILQ